MAKIALIVLYNHRHEPNIELVERLYRGRFGEIFHLMPFYGGDAGGDRPNVIPVYGSSWHFQGFVAQGLSRYGRPDFTHYLFVADDLLLNPVLDESNLLGRLGLPDGHCFLPKFTQYLTGPRGAWRKTRLAHGWKLRAPGLEPDSIMPSYDEAVARFRRHGVEVVDATFPQVWRVPRTPAEWLEALRTEPGLWLGYPWAMLTRRRYRFDYPLVGGYSDLFIVTAGAIRDFARYCGVFAASGLFVELAIPTAMLLAAPAISVEASLRLRGKTLWTRDELRQLDAFGGSLRALCAGFDPTRLYLHPVKLSGWVMDLDTETVHRLEASRIVGHPGYRRQVENVRVEGDDVCLVSTGDDPRLHLPDLPVDPSRPASIVVDLTVPAGCTVDLFWQPVGASEFTGEHMASWTVRAGRHRLVRRTDLPLNGRLRLDPGNIPGEFRIHRIEVHQ
jgi:hypothetical protein